MKKLILSFSFIFICSIQGKAQQHAQYGFYDKYYLGVLDNGRQHTYSYFSGMNLNLWMHYGMQVTQMFPEGFERGWYDWDIHDLESANISEYEHTVRDVVMYTNGTLGYRTVAERPKISRLCFAQRSDYYCNQNHIDPYYDFYAFSEHDGRDEDFHDAQYNSNKWVRHCRISESNNPHMVVTGLLANREQVNITGPCSAWQIDGYHTFYIKPKIRIPIHLPDETEVCNIKVYSWDGATVIKDVTIKAKYFKDPETFQYDGR